MDIFFFIYNKQIILNKIEQLKKSQPIYIKKLNIPKSEFIL